MASKEITLPSISHDGQLYRLWANPDEGYFYIIAESSIPYGSERIARRINSVHASGFDEELEDKIYKVLSESKATSHLLKGKSNRIAESKVSTLPKSDLADDLNKILTKNFFHYHVGDTISSAIGAPFFFKGNVLSADNGNTLRIRLEPNRQLKSPNHKFIIIEVKQNVMGEIDIRVSYKEYRDGRQKDVVLWENSGQGFYMTDMPGLDGIIQNHKPEIAENYNKALQMEGTDISGQIESASQSVVEKIGDKNTAPASGSVMSEYEKERQRQIEAKEIAPESEGISLYHLAKSMETKPKPTTTDLTESQQAATDTHPEITPTTHEIEALVHGSYDNAYELNRAIEQTIDMLKAGNGELTAEVKQFISTYSGMGGLEKFGASGKGLLYEYFTPDEIIKRMWGLAYKHGYQIGMSVMEPAVGTGRFLKYLPDNTRCLALEINPYSKYISEALYGHKAEIRQQYFEQLFIKNNESIKGRTNDIEKFDLVIGNPPYGEFAGRWAGMGEKAYTKAGNYIEYFILRGLDCLNQGGLLVMIIGAEVASGARLFLDSPMNAVKEKIAEKGELIDAYRMPSGVFDRSDVTTEVVVIKRK